MPDTPAPVNPATGEPLGHYPYLPDRAVEDALARAASAFERHRESSFEERAAGLVRIADRLERDARHFGELMTREMGKPIRQAVAEAEKCAWACRYYAEHAEGFLADERRASEAQRSFVAYQPLGPVLAVMPWNFPFWQVIRFAAPAVMAGNVGLLKHASNVPECARALADLFSEDGRFGPGVFQNLWVGREAVERVIADRRVAAVTLTGSGPAGRSVGAAAGRALKPSVLELGGSDPFVVLADADLDRAVEVGVHARMQNNGESCIAAKRFILEKPIAEAFTERFVAALEALTVGDPMDEATDVGPMARADLRDELHEQVQQAVKQGAKVLTGAKKLDRAGYYYAPTALGGVRPGMVPFDEELFGPVAALTVAEDEADAVRLANHTPFGLGAVVFTEDRARGERVARRLDAGNAFVNQMVKSHPNLPFGGIKESGYGRELSRHGIRAFTNAKTIWID